MDALSSTIENCKLQLRLDNNTEGYGNCFPNAIVQQCRRPEIKEWIQTHNPEAFVATHYALRRKVKAFALNSTHKTLNDYKRNFESIVPEENSWTEYWEKMGKTGTWVDSTFVQVTAWFIGLDILILTTSSRKDDPFIRMIGNQNNPEEPAVGPQLLIGNYTNVHYQSLLPLSNYEKKIQKETRSLESKMNNQQDSKQDDYLYIHEGEQITFLGLENEKLQCPFCNKAFQRIDKHMDSKKCNISKQNIDATEFSSQLKAFRDGFRIEIRKVGLN